MARVEWQFGQDSVTRNEIADLEKEWGVTFPPPFVEVVLACHGGVPEPGDIQIAGKRTTTVQCLIPIVAPVHDDDHDSIHMRRNYEWVQDRLPDGVFPFAQEPGGDLFCFDYCDVETEPTIAYWDHDIASPENPEGGITFVASSFSAMLSMLFREPDYFRLVGGWHWTVGS